MNVDKEKMMKRLRVNNVFNAKKSGRTFRSQRTVTSRCNESSISSPWTHSLSVSVRYIVLKGGGKQLTGETLVNRSMQAWINVAGQDRHATSPA